MIELVHFNKNGNDEFQGWRSQMDRVLLAKLDSFRNLLDSPVIISPAMEAIGRHLGKEKESYHNIDYHGSVKAVDIFPTVNGSLVNDTDTLYKLLGLADSLLFGGVGLYLNTHYKGQSAYMMHLDIRPFNSEKLRWFDFCGKLDYNMENYKKC